MICFIYATPVLILESPHILSIYCCQRGSGDRKKNSTSSVCLVFIECWDNPQAARKFVAIAGVSRIFPQQYGFL
jgi:hypothetical protein